MINILKETFELVCDDCNSDIENCDNTSCGAKKYYKQLQQALEENEELKNKLNCFKRLQAEVNIKSRKLKKIKEYINSQGIDNKWNMRIQKFRQGILQILEEQE